MIKRKPVLLIDGSEKSQEAVILLKTSGIEYVEYDMRKFAESCCGDLPTTKDSLLFLLLKAYSRILKASENMSIWIEKILLLHKVKVPIGKN